MILKTLKNNQLFYDEIKSMIDSEYDIMDAITTYCIKNNVDIEVAGSWIKHSQELKGILEDYARTNSLLVKE